MSRTLLILADWFAPGVRAGGPIRSCSNLALLLRDSCQIWVVTSAFDLGVSEPYDGIPVNQWEPWKNATRVFYSSSTAARLWQTLKVVWSARTSANTTIYLNSMFSGCGTLFPLLLRKLVAPRLRCVLAPRGMLKSTALAHKSWKKKPLLSFLKWSGLVKRICFHATSSEEVDEILAAFPGSDVVHIPNIPASPQQKPVSSRKVQGRLRLLFVGRIHPIKNLHYLLERLATIRHQVELSIIGPEEDSTYVHKCKQMAAHLPSNLTVEFLGPQPEEVISQQLQNTDALVLPTEGENFGHAIFEAFAAGVPVIISDRTIWRDLPRRFAGWDLPLESPESFEQAFDLLGQMGPQEHERWQDGALSVAQEFLSSSDLRARYENLFWPNASASTVEPQGQSSN